MGGKLDLVMTSLLWVVGVAIVPPIIDLIPGSNLLPLWAKIGLSFLFSGLFLASMILTWCLAVVVFMRFRANSKGETHKNDR